MQLFTIQKKNYTYYVLAALLCLFIIVPVDIPHELASLIDPFVGKVVVIILALNLFFVHGGGGWFGSKIN